MNCFRRSDPHSCDRMQVAERCVNTPRPTHLTDVTGKGADVIMTHPNPDTRAAAKAFLDSLPEVDGDLDEIVREANREGYEKVMRPGGAA